MLNKYIQLKHGIRTCEYGPWVFAYLFNKKLSGTETYCLEYSRIGIGYVILVTWIWVISKYYLSCYSGCCLFP